MKVWRLLCFRCNRSYHELSPPGIVLPIQCHSRPIDAALVAAMRPDLPKLPGWRDVRIVYAPLAWRWANLPIACIPA